MEPEGEQAAADIALVKGWRSAHSNALTITRNGLGVIVMRTLGLNSQAGLVTQRLKRFDSIVEKLIRTKPRLAEIEDIAGCRSVLPTLSLVHEVHRHVAEAARKLEIVQVKDYIKDPHAGGYRALHLWCRRDGFKVEIQLRTAAQQDWAERVEAWDKILGLDVKHERAPDVVLEFFRQLADYYYQLDSGVAHSMVDVSALRAATTAVKEWLAGEV